MEDRVCQQRQQQAPTSGEEAPKRMHTRTGPYVLDLSKRTLTQNSESKLHIGIEYSIILVYIRLLIMRSSFSKFITIFLQTNVKLE